MSNRVTKPTVTQIMSTTLRNYIEEHWIWSQETFGPGEHMEGLLKHIEKECNEVRKMPHDIMEGVDIVILAIDLMCRMGYSSDEIAAAIIEKQNINRLREYPKITDPDQPTEHVREEGKMCLTCNHTKSEHTILNGCGYKWPNRTPCECRGFHG